MKVQRLEDYFEYINQQKINIHNQLQQNGNLANEGVVNLIIAALSSSDTQQRNNADLSLQLMRQSDVTLHLEDILKTIALSSNPQTLLYLVSYTSTLVKSLQKIKVFSEDEVLLNILAHFFLLFQNRNLTQQQSKILIECLPYLLDLSCSTNQPDWFLLTTLKEVEKLFDQSKEKRDIYIGLNIIHALIMEVFGNEKIRDVLISLLQKMFMILETMANFIFTEIASQQRDLSNLEGNLQILEMTCHILTISIQRVQNQKSDLMQVFLGNLQLMNFFEMVISFNFNQALQLQNIDSQISLITFDQSQEGMRLNSLFSVINGIKYNSLKSLVVMNQFYLLKEQQTKLQMFDTAQVQQNYCYFLQKFENILLYICKQLHLCINNQSPQYMSHIHVLLSLVCNNSRDYDCFADDGDEFMRFEQDLYNNRDSDILKSNACELIYKLAESIDGFLAYATSYSSKMIDLVYKKKSNDQVFQEQLLKYQHSLFLNLENANKIETILLLLVVLAPQIGQRRDLLKQLENVLTVHFSSNLVMTSGICRLRCSALISHYSIYLFTEFDRQTNLYVPVNTKLLSDMVIFLIKYLKNTQELIGVGAATDTLWRLIKSWELKGCMESIITDVIETLVELISVTKNEVFFEFLENVIHNFSYIIKNYATEIIKNLCNRIATEQNKVKGRKYESSLLIMKCIGCIIQFVTDEKIFNDFYIYFEENILQLIKYLDVAEQIQFDDKLCELCTYLLPQFREFEEIMEVVGRNLDKLFEKNNKSVNNDSFYDLLIEIFKSEYLQYDKQYILCSVFRIALDSIKQLNIDRLNFQYPEFIHACFLIQLGIQYNHEVFNSKQKLYEDIMIYLIELYPTLTSQQFYPLKYIQVFLLFFYYQPAQTINATKNSNIIVSLLQGLEQQYIQHHLEQPYDRKVLSYGLIGLINNWQQCSLNYNDVTKLFKLALYTLNYSKNPTTSASKMISEYKHKGSIEQSAKSSRPQFNDEDTWLQSNEDPTDLYDINVSDLEYEKLANYYYTPERDFYPKIEKFNPPAYKCDEYSMYRQMLKNLKKEHPELLNAILQSLDEEENKLYNSIVKAHIVQTSNNQFAVRQIKTIKKKNQVYQKINYPNFGQEDQMEDNNRNNFNNQQNPQQFNQNQNSMIGERIIDEDI